MTASDPAPRAYDQIIGLGHNCRLAYNLRRTFGNTRAFPFDWWITPLPSVLAFLRDPSVERLYDPALLEEARDERGVGAIRNSHYDIELHHEFPRTPKGLVVSDWREHIGKPRARTDFLLKRLFACREAGRLLFVRSTSKHEGRALGDRFRPRIDELRQVLRALFPDSEVDLLLIDSRTWVEAPGVMNLSVGDLNRTDWRGTPSLWTDRLLGAGLAWAGRSSGPPPDPDPDQEHSSFTP